jgi:hypothetical protein
MKAIRHAVVGLLLVLLVGSAASAQTETAVDMLLTCRTFLREASNDSFTSGQCWGAFAALQGIARLDASGQQRRFEICVPATVPRESLIAAFVTFAENHPKRWHEDFVVVALDVLRDTYPCSTASVPPPRK